MGGSRFICSASRFEMLLLPTHQHRQCWCLLTHTCVEIACYEGYYHALYLSIVSCYTMYNTCFSSVAIQVVWFIKVVFRIMDPAFDRAELWDAWFRCLGDDGFRDQWSRWAYFYSLVIVSPIDGNNHLLRRLLLLLWALGWRQLLLWWWPWWQLVLCGLPLVLDGF